MTAVITKSNIESGAHNNILAYIDNRTYIKDPKYSSLTTKQRDFVYDFDPILKSVTFGDFPYIVLRLPTVEYTTTKNSTNGKVKTVSWRQDLIVRTARYGSGNTFLNSDMLDICDDLQQMFNNETVKSALRLLNIYDINLTKTDFDAISVQEKSVLESVYELTYSTRLTVSD